jgi:hypothetical protein
MEDILIVQSDLKPSWLSCCDRRHKVKYNGCLTLHQCADNCECNTTGPPRVYILEIHTAQPISEVALEWYEERSAVKVELYEYGPMTIQQLQECGCDEFKILSTTPVIVDYPVLHLEVNVESIQSIIGFSYIESIWIWIFSQEELDHISPTFRKLHVRELTIWCNFQNPIWSREITLFRKVTIYDRPPHWVWYQQQIEIVVSLIYAIQNRRLPMLLEHCHILKEMLW